MGGCVDAKFQDCKHSVFDSCYWSVSDEKCHADAEYIVLLVVPTLVPIIIAIVIIVLVCGCIKRKEIRKHAFQKAATYAELQLAAMQGELILDVDKPINNGVYNHQGMPVVFPNPYSPGQEADLIHSSMIIPGEFEITDLCFLDVQIAKLNYKRIVIGIFGNDNPVSAKLFRNMCNGSLRYNFKDKYFNHISRNNWVYGGDFDVMRFPPSWNAFQMITDPVLQRESQNIQHFKTCVSLCVSNLQTNGCPLKIHLRENTDYNGKDIVVGRVLEGFDWIFDEMQLAADKTEYFARRVKIVNCGAQDYKDENFPKADPNQQTQVATL